MLSVGVKSSTPRPSATAGKAKFVILMVWCSSAYFLAWASLVISTSSSSSATFADTA